MFYISPLLGPKEVLVARGLLEFVKFKRQN